MYKEVKDLVGVVRTDQILLIRDGQVFYIPADEGNKDWQEYQAWLNLGNTPEAAD